jgi:hypothetical protein
MAVDVPRVDEPEDDELVLEDVDAPDDTLCPDEPAIPRAVGRFGRAPGPTDETPVGELAPGTDGVGTVGVWIAGPCTGTVTGGGLGGVTVTGVGFGTVTGTGGGFGTEIVGAVTVGTVTVGLGTEVTVGTVSAGLV